MGGGTTGRPAPVVKRAGAGAGVIGDCAYREREAGCFAGVGGFAGAFGMGVTMLTSDRRRRRVGAGEDGREGNG